MTLNGFKLYLTLSPQVVIVSVIQHFRSNNCQHCRASDSMLVIDCMLGKLLTGHEEGEVHVTSIQGSFRLKMLAGETNKMQIMSLVIVYTSAKRPDLK